RIPDSSCRIRPWQGAFRAAKSRAAPTLLHRSAWRHQDRAPQRKRGRSWRPLTRLASLATFSLQAGRRWSRRRAGFHQLEDDRIHQGLERGIDDIRRHADRGPAFARLVLAFDEHARDRRSAAVEDAHTEVRELQAVDIFLVLAEVLAQRKIERI